MNFVKNSWSVCSGLQTLVNSNLSQKIAVNMIPFSNHLTINKSGIHTAVFGDGLNLLNASYNDVKNVNVLRNGSMAISSNYISVRNKGKKGKWAVGPTKIKGRTPGKSRGLKVYDGQRVPIGTCLVNQMRPVIFPGWNVSFKSLYVKNYL